MCDFMSIRAFPDNRYNKCASVGMYEFHTCYIGLSSLYRWPGESMDKCNIFTFG